MKQYLPMGSVVRLNKSKGKLIIMGRQQKRTDTNAVFDYAALLYPFGKVDNNIVLFNEEDIEEILFRGFCDIDEQKYVALLNNEPVDSV